MINDVPVPADSPGSPGDSAPSTTPNPVGHTDAQQTRTDAQQTRADARRSQFLREALSQFIERGYHGTSMRSVSQACGTSPGLLFHYFPTKDALYDELVRIGTGHLTVDVEAGLANPLNFFRKAAADSFAMAVENPDAVRMFVFMAGAQRDLGVTETSAALLRDVDVVARCVPIIEAGQERGEIRDGDPLGLSLLFWGAIQGSIEELARREDRPVIEADWLVGLLNATREG